MKKEQTRPPVIVFGILVLLFMYVLLYALRIRTMDGYIIMALVFAASWASLGSVTADDYTQKQAKLDSYATFLLHEIELGYEYTDEVFNAQSSSMGSALDVEPLAAYWGRLSGMVFFRRQALDMWVIAGDLKEQELRKYAKCLLQCYNIWDAQMRNRIEYVSRMRSDLAGETEFRPTWYDDVIKKDDKISSDLEKSVAELRKCASAKKLL